MTTLQRPRSSSDLFWTMTWLSLQGFGGVLSVAQRELVEKKRWSTHEQFVEDWAVAQTLPGPNVVNLSLMIGSRYFGMRGALAALSGLLLFPLILLLVLAVLNASVAQHPVAQGALRGMGAVTAGLIAAAGLKMVPTLRSNTMGLPMCLLFMALTFVAVAWLRIPLAWVLLGIGGSACAWTWYVLGKLPAPRPEA
ncbi:MAG TPA: chromate transporter [Macromonas sp.]|nr:chromate transporter [Macromonas sp.]